MRNILRRASRAAVVLTAVSLGAVLAIPTAHAASPGVSLVDTYCDDMIPLDGVAMRSCWFPAYDDVSGEYMWAAGVILKIPNGLDPSSWSRCTVRSAIYRNSRSSGYARMRPAATTDNGALDSTCLPKFREYSTNATRFYFYDENFITFQPGACYYNIGRWFGTYAGQTVGMDADGPFPRSLTKCGPSTGVAPVDTLDAPIVDVPEVLDVPTMVAG